MQVVVVVHYLLAHTNVGDWPGIGSLEGLVHPLRKR